MRVGWRLLLLAVLIGVSSCSLMRSIGGKSCHDAQAYMKAGNEPPLVIPPGLDPVDTTNALRLPALKEPAPPARSAKAPCLDEPPPFKVKQPARSPQA